MFKKTKNSLAMSLSVAMLATMVTIPGVASAATGTQISGKDRYETALKIVQDGWDKSDSAVIARGDDLADALSAAPLAYAKGKAPILLTKTTEIPAGVLQELKDLGVKNVYIVGGVGAVSKTVADQLAAAGLTITRVQGADRYETSLAVAKEAFSAAPADVVIANGLAYADALSVSSIAASKGMPILLVNNSKLTAEQSAYIAGKTVYAVGGEGVLNADVVSVSKATRLAGADRYATNAAVLAKFDFDYSKLYLAKGTPANLVDSLAGSALAAKTNSPIVLVDGSNKLNSALATVVTDKIKDDTAIVRLGGTVTQAAADAVETLKTAVNVGTLKVEAVSAIAANQIKVTFNKAVTDTSKILPTVLRGTTPVAVTTVWNTAMTEATLTSAANLPEGSYSVNVKNDTTDLGTSTVAITQQKIAKIVVTSTKLGVVNAVGSTPQKGYATYKVLDQYGNDITNSALANSVQFQTGVGTATPSKGLLSIEPAAGLNLMSFTSGVVVTANDTNTGVSTSATLICTSQIGTLSDISLTTLTNKDNKVLTANSPTTLFYAGFVATDISGNPTTNFTLMKEGLILNTNAGFENQLTTSNPDVTATLVQDPTDSTKGVIEVKSSNKNVSMDMPIVITAMTWTGKTSQLSTTLKKQAAVAKVTLMAPAADIASDESKVIPYTAVDQNGATLTSWDDIVKDDASPLTTFTNIVVSKAVDGTLILKNKKQPNTGTSSVPLVLSAMVSGSATGYSSITVNIQKAIKADSLSVDSTKLISTMENGAVQKLDFGYDKGGLSVKDQYGREMDLSNVDSAKYQVVTSVSSGNSVELLDMAGAVTASGTAYAGFQTAIRGKTTGTSSVKFRLIDTTEKWLTAGKDADTTPHAAGDLKTKSADFSAIDEKLVTLTVVASDDIKGYTVGAVTDPIYTSATSSAIVADLTSNVKDYAAKPKVFGKTASGTQVKLTDANVTIKAYVDSSDFLVSPGVVAFDGIKVYAKQFTDSAKLASSTTLTVIVTKVSDNSVKTVTTNIKSTTAAPVASTIIADVTTDPDTAKLNSGISVDGDAITVDRTVDANALIYSGLVQNNYLTRYDVAGNEKHGLIFLATKDQYGKQGIKLSQITLVSAGTTGIAMDANGMITTAPTTAGTMKITGVSNNGLVKTITITIK